MQNLKSIIDNETLYHFLECNFNVDVVTDYEYMKRYVSDPNFPNRNEEFKKALADAILYHKITPETYERITDAELETQEEIDELLVNDIWKVIYGNEPIR